MKEMSGVVTLLLDGQMVCWNSYTISGIQVWPLLMATRALLVAKKKKKKSFVERRCLLQNPFITPISEAIFTSCMNPLVIVWDY